MSGITSILVPLDGSSCAEQALPMAEYLAQLTRSGLDLVMVHQPAPLWYAPGSGVGFTGFDHAVRRRELVYLERVAGRFTAGTGLPVQSRLLDGNVVPAIDEFVQHHSVDLIVMTTHARDGLSRLWRGSVAEGLVRALGIPVLVIHPEHNPPAAVPAVSRILVPLDGSPWAESILHQAKEVARLTGAALVLARVVLPDPAGAHELRARRYLDQAQSQLEAEGFHADIRLVVGRHVSHQILRVATAERCDLILLATHGLTGRHRALRASTADAVVRGTTVPVLIQQAARAPATKPHRAEAVGTMAAAPAGGFHMMTAGD